MRKVSILLLLCMAFSMPLHAQEPAGANTVLDTAVVQMTKSIASQPPMGIGALITLSQLYERQDFRENKPKQEIQPQFVVLHHGLQPSGLVALTFDDGGNYSQVMAILEVLQLHQAKATFFLLGQWADDNPDLVRQIIVAGHEIANHSYYHPSFTRSSSERISSEVSKTQAVLQAHAGVSYRPYFRPPYGDYDRRVSSILEEMGYHALVMWDVDSRDWTGVDGSLMAERVLSQTGDGSILLFHLHGAHTAEALRYLLPALQGQGYRFGTISEML